jgi:ornithine cyclodeaminase
MRVVDAETIRALATPDLVISSVRAGLIAHAAGEIVSPPPGHLGFTDPPGDCHIKFGRAHGAPVFVIKVATGFYDNPKRGLSSSNGLMLVLSAETGAPLALLDDQGWLTDARTAAAGVLAVEAARPNARGTLGMIGTGVQAALQARWIARHHGFAEIAIWGRNRDSADRMVRDLNGDGIEARACASSAEVAAGASVIITCTPSREPVLSARDVGSEHLIVAVGADVPGKRELDREIIDRADWIICDDIERCLDHGEIQGLAPGQERLLALGQQLASKERLRPGLTIVDLTGLPAQDIAVATEVYGRITTSRS